MRVLAAGPHPDDVESAAAGTLALAAQRGYAVKVVCPNAHPEFSPHAAVDGADRSRLLEAAEAATVLGADFEELPVVPYEGHRTTLPMMVELLRRSQPHVVFVNTEDDVHPFHRQIAQLTLEAVFLAQLPTVRTEHEPWTVSQIFRYGAFTARNFLPDTFVDVTSTFSLARRALAAHSKGLVQLPGLTHWANNTRTHYGLQTAVPYAEGFSVYRGYPFDHIEHRQVGYEFVSQLNALAIRSRTV